MRPGRTARLLPLATVLVACAPSLPADHPEVATLDSARFRLEGEPPARARQVSLPDSWPERRPSAGGFGRYELRLAGPLPRERAWALLLPSVNMNAEVFVNGTRLGSGASFEEPVAQNFNRPLFFPFPASLASEPSNLVVVRLFAYPHAQGGLGEVWVGPDEALRPAWERSTLLQVGLAQLATAIAWLTALFIGALWVGTRFDGAYGWFALSISLWSIASLNYWVRDIPVGHWTWERIIHPSFEGFAIALAVWAHRFLGLRRPRLEAGLAAFGVTVLVATSVVPASLFYPVVNAAHAGSLLVGGYATAIVFGRARSFSAWERVLYTTGGAVGLAFAAHDLSLQLGWIAPSSARLFPYLVPVILLGFGASLVARFASSLETAETLNRELERRVAEKSEELARNHDRLRSLERDRTLATERERIMREMHDGLGGQLVSALTAVESGDSAPAATAAALRTALADMRVVIDSLDPALGDLAALVGALRARIAPLLDRAGMQLRWKVADLPGELRLGPERSLHLLRIVQEAITNAVRHAGATTLVVEARPDGDVLWIEVRDDGCSFDPSSVPAGRGLANMRKRADALGAELVIDCGTAGTRVAVSLSWPGSAADAALSRG